MSLVILLVLTLLGMSAVQNTGMQERMAAAGRDSNLAFHAAESALRDAEAFLETRSSLVLFENGDNADGLFVEVAPGATPVWADGALVDWATATNVVTAPTMLAGVAAQPMYVIEHLKTIRPHEDVLNLDNIGQDIGAARVQVFRVTAVGVGGTSAARVVVQGTYAKQF